MSTTLELPPSSPVKDAIVRRPLLERVDTWTRLGAPAAEPELAVPVRAGGAAVLLTLVVTVCTCIYAIKCVIGFDSLWSKEGSAMPLVIFDRDPETPLWKSVPLALGRTWLCSAEDFVVGLAILLASLLVLQQLIPFVERHRLLNRAIRWSIWAIDIGLIVVTALTVGEVLPRLLLWTIFGLAIAGIWFVERQPWRDRTIRWHFWGTLYVCAIVAIGLMIVDMFLFFSVDQFLDKKKILMAGNFFSMEKSVQDEVTLTRKLLLILVPVGALALQLLIVQVFPRFWHRVAYYVCRPVAVCAGLVAFVGLTFWVQTPGHAFDRNYGNFMHNPHLYLASTYVPDEVLVYFGGWGVEYVPIAKGEVPDFLPGHPGTGDLKLEKDKRPKNIIFIVIESGGSHWMHDYGSPFPTTPNLDQLEKDKKCIVCENTYAISDHTIASAIALFGSMNNHDCENCAVYDARNYDGPNKNFPVPAASTWLRNHGYRTYFMGAGGKSVWQGYKNLGEAFLPYGFDIAKDGYKHWGKETPKWGFKEDDHDDNSLFDDAYRCLDDAKQKDKPFFLMMWNYDTHWKYTDGEGPTDWDESKFPAMVQKDPGDGDHRMAQFHRYLKSIWRFDRLVTKLYKDLEKRGLADDTLLVITGDHGQSFGHHGIWTHGYKLYEEEVRVPLIFINKNLGEYAAEHKSGPRNGTLCSHLDIWPTIMDICNLPCNSKWQGKSIFTTEIEPEKRHAYLWVGGLWSIREGDYKYIYDKEDKELYLFNIKEDPGEENNLLKQNPEKFKGIKDRLHNQLHKWLGWQAGWNKEMLKSGKRD